jgi:hypothetical protein
MGIRNLFNESLIPYLVNFCERKGLHASVFQSADLIKSMNTCNAFLSSLNKLKNIKLSVQNYGKTLSAALCNHKVPRNTFSEPMTCRSKLYYSSTT